MAAPTRAALALAGVLLPAGAAITHSASRQPTPPADPNPCLAGATARAPRRPPVILPADEAALRPDFLAFRRSLQETVARRDEAGVLRIVDPAIHVSFGGAEGIDDFKSFYLDEPDFWDQFEKVLSLGGTFFDRDRTMFIAPYVFARWPDGPDGFECWAVTAAGVRVRRAASTDAPVVAAVAFVVVRLIEDGRDTPGWLPVQLADGATGYIAERFLRSPVDLRAVFEYKSGRWWLTTYIAGD